MNEKPEKEAATTTLKEIALNKMEQPKEELDPSFTSTTVSLQECFKKFKNERHSKFAYHQYLKTCKQVERQSDEYKKVLREKFVETAKKYLGVPYAKRQIDSSNFIDQVS